MSIPGSPQFPAQEEKKLAVWLVPAEMKDFATVGNANPPHSPNGFELAALPELSTDDWTPTDCGDTTAQGC